MTVDLQTKTYRFNHEYYMLKHVSHFVMSGAKCLETTGTHDDALGFVNPDGSVVVVMRNEAQHEQFVDMREGGRMATVRLLPDSISTVTMKAWVRKGKRLGTVAFRQPAS